MFYGIVAMCFAPRRGGREAALQALFHRLSLNRKSTSSTSCSEVREAEEIERGRLPPRQLRLLLGHAPKLNKAGLLWVECQPVFLKSLGEHLEYFLRIFLILKAEERIIGVADFEGFALETRCHLVLEP